ncbi:MAG: hypothetical protein QOH57_4951 [Mycobacterium sp.]|jgi:nicotinamidase-related amidase|nr:hypothetical protein [Mycobacterium sp.]
MSDTAVLVIDMLNAYDHPDAKKLIPNVEKIMDPLAELIENAGRRDDVDVIYVNDNYGNFEADHQDLVRSALDGERPDLVEPIVPQPGSLFLQKVRHSAFYSTALGYLLGQRNVGCVVLTGQVLEQCILYTALDAYVRHFDLFVARDAVAHIDEELGDAALKMMERNMRAKIADTSTCLS